jgi:hypothetical protein
MKNKGGKKVPNCVPVKEEENAVEEAAKGTLHRVRYSHDSSSGNGIASGNLSLHAPDKESASRYAESDLKKRGKKNIKIHAVTPQKSSIKEAKEKTEYDYEGDMARGQLQSIINNSQRVHDMLEDNDNLPEWVQSKITLAEDYISTVANYLMSEIDEEVVQEATYVVKHDGVADDHADADAKKLFAGKTNVNSHVSKYASSAEKHADMLKSKGFKNVRIQTMNKEEFMQEDKAEFKPVWSKTGKEATHRETGEKTHEYLEMGHDGKPTGKRQYRNAQGKSMGESVQQEEVEQLEEGRPSQRHPLEGHEYHKKSNEALIHIAKDAHKAAEAMKSHNTDAENKYRDQANDSATVRYFRQKNGMPDWYKKKYGHMKEQMSNAPFDPPYSKKTGTHIDKSGAKHGPMSIARDLARTAAAKQAKSINKSDPTRKASIVREAMKDAAIKDEKKKDDKKVTGGGKDKFQPDPEISTQIIRQE